MKRIHLISGITVLIVFLLTGQYMDRFYDHLHGMPDLPRMLYRSRHIYILLSALVNVSLGLYLTMQYQPWRRVTQSLGSALIVMATGLMIGAFFYEPKHPDYITPFSRWGLYLILAGTLLHLVSGLRQSRKE